MNKHVVGFSLLAVALSATAAQAQGPISIIEVGAFGQYTKLDDKLKMDNVIAGGVRGGVSVYRWLGVEADIQYGPTKANRPPNEDIKYSPFHGLATLTIPVSNKVGLILGGGYVNSIYKGRSTKNEYEDGVSGLVGLKFCTEGHLGVRVDGLVDYNPSPNEQALTGTSKNLGIRAGLTYALRGGCGKAGKPFDWALALAPASATVARNASRQFALSAADAETHPIEMRKVNSLMCTSSDPSVATVDNTGNVKALKAGNTTVTCKGLVKNLERTASSSVNVPAPEWTLSINPPSQSRNVGESATFTITARDADGTDLGGATTWTSSNTNVATVSNTGAVTCVGGGTATITATKTAYGASKSTSATVTCVAPAPPPPPVGGMIRLDSTHFNFDKAIVLPAGKAILQTVVDAMKRDPNINISVEGHTDWYGDDSYNDKLAASRAAAVTAAIKKLAGTSISSGRISTKGYGEQCIIVRDGDPDPSKPRPRISAANKAKQAPNRRVEIWQLLPNETGSPASCRAESQRNGRVPFASMK